MMIESVEKLLLSKEPKKDPNIEIVNAIVAEIQKDRSICSVDEIADRLNTHRRGLQRLLKK